MSITKTFNTILVYFTSCIILSCNNIASATVSIECTLTTPNIIFNAFNPYDATFEEAIGSVKVKCFNDTGGPDDAYYRVILSPGSSGDQNARLGKNVMNSISYNLYKDSTYTQILGDGTNGTVYFTRNYRLSNKGSRTDTFIIYAKIPVQPLAKPMTYIDTINAYLIYFSN